MKIKMRVLTATNKGKLLSIADMIAAEKSNYKADIIPPAYPCETERLVVVIASAAAKYSTAIEIFCKNMNKSQAQNVAFIIDGDKEKAQQLIDWVKSAGANVCDDVLYINGGLPFKFMKKVSDAEKTQVNEWLENVLKTMA